MSKPQAPDLCVGCPFEHDLSGCISAKDSECKIKTK